jgi:hypothetical protein
MNQKTGTEEKKTNIMKYFKTVPEILKNFI